MGEKKLKNITGICQSENEAVSFARLLYSLHYLSFYWVNSTALQMGQFQAFGRNVLFVSHLHITCCSLRRKDMKPYTSDTSAGIQYLSSRTVFYQEDAAFLSCQTAVSFILQLFVVYYSCIHAETQIIC